MKHSHSEKFVRNAIIGCLVAFMLAFFYRWAERYDQIHTLVSNLEEKANDASPPLLEKDALSLQKDLATLQNEAFKSEDNSFLTLVQILSGVLVFGGFFVTLQGQDQERKKNEEDHEIAKESLISDRFFKAINLLGDSNSSKHISGIYTLESIAQAATEHDSGHYRKRTIRILTAFIKEQSPFPALKKANQELEQEEDRHTAAPLDIKVALEVIHDLWRTLDHDKTDLKVLDLNSVKLKGLKFPFDSCWKSVQIENSYLNDIEFIKSDLTASRFSQSTLENVRFGAANLYRSSFREATLRDVNFEKANLQKVNFREAKILERVSFERADLKEAAFQKAVFEEPNFKGTNLESVTFNEASLKGARFTPSIGVAEFTGAPLDAEHPDAIRRTILRKVDFIGAILKEADFTNADLENVNFTDADLENALFIGAVLKEVDFTGAKNLESAKGLELKN